MSLILRQVIGYQQGRKSVPTSTNPLLKKQLADTQNQLNSILNKWKFGDTPIRTSEEFLNNFEPWINSQLEKQKELKLFLAKKGVNSLKDLADLPTSESEQLKFYKDNLKTKEQIIEDYKNQEQIWNNTETDYLRRIEELKENQANSLSPEQKEKLDSYDDLETEKDQAIREKKTLEQQNLALNNRLKLKHQEAANKEKALEKLTKEKNQAEVQQQKALKEKNSLITTLNLETRQLNKKIEALEKQITELKK